MTSTLDHHRTTTRDAVRRSGTWCAVAGIIGALQGIGLLFWPEDVSDDRFSYPFTAGDYVIAQGTFFLQHLPLVVAVAVLAGLPAVRAHRTARLSLVAGATGLALLAVMELVAMSAATTDLDSTLGQTVSALYGPPVILIGAGLTIGGIAVLRRRLVPSATAWLLTALGGWVFVGLTPALASADFLAGRLAIVLWMLGFVGLGWVMRQRATRAGTI